MPSHASINCAYKQQQSEEPNVQPCSPTLIMHRMVYGYQAVGLVLSPTKLHVHAYSHLDPCTAIQPYDNQQCTTQHMLYVVPVSSSAERASKQTSRVTLSPHAKHLTVKHLNAVLLHLGAIRHA